MKAQKHPTPLLSALTASMLCASLLAGISAHSIYQKYNTDGWSQPAIAVLMQGLAHHGTASASFNVYTDITSSSDQSHTEKIQEVSSGKPEVTPQETVPAGPQQSGQPGNAPVDPQESEQPEPTATPTEPETYSFTEVTQEYFDDALFIGDSRVTGVKLYSGWDNITYYAENGMTIYNMFQRDAEKEDDKMLSVEEALQTRSFVSTKWVPAMWIPLWKPTKMPLSICKSYSRMLLSTSAVLCMSNRVNRNLIRFSIIRISKNAMTALLLWPTIKISSIWTSMNW